jgi:transposase
MARPTKCTRATTDRVAALVAGGMPPVSAARLVGVGASTFHRWMQRGGAVAHLEPAAVPRDERPFREFRERIEQAQAQDEARLMQVVRRHAMADAPDSWRAARWALERRHRSNWAETRSASASQAAEEPTPQGGTILTIVEAARRGVSARG